MLEQKPRNAAQLPIPLAVKIQLVQTSLMG